MKSVILAATAIVLTSGAALAAPYHFNNRWHHSGGNVSSYERAAIGRSAAQLASVKRRAWADGKLTFFERFQIRIAENRHNAVVARARRS
jgi:hypothetical protein